EVHVWRASLDIPSICIHRLEKTLAVDEHERAARFYFLRDRLRFIVARGLLRAILGRYLRIEPPQLRFCYGRYGKPVLDQSCGGDILSFNLSHSDDKALYAVAYKRSVGIDIERVRPEFPIDEIAERFFSKKEAATLRSIPPVSKVEAFFNCWTR